MNLAINFVQAAPATVWSITHEFTGVPIADVMVDDAGDLVKVLPESQVAVSATVLEIRFSSPRAGKARVYGNVEYLALGSGAGSIDPEITY